MGTSYLLYTKENGNKVTMFLKTMNITLCIFTNMLLDILQKCSKNTKYNAKTVYVVNVFLERL